MILMDVMCVCQVTVGPWSDFLGGRPTERHLGVCFPSGELALPCAAQRSGVLHWLCYLSRPMPGSKVEAVKKGEM